MRSADGPQEGSGRPLSSWAAWSCRAPLPRDRTGSQLGQELLCKPAGVSPEANPGLGMCTQLSPELPGAHRPGHRTQEKGNDGLPGSWRFSTPVEGHACPCSRHWSGGSLSGSPLASEIAFQVRWPGIPKSGHWQGNTGQMGDVAWPWHVILHDAPCLGCPQGQTLRRCRPQQCTGRQGPRGPWRRALAGGGGGLGCLQKPILTGQQSGLLPERAAPRPGAVRPGTQTREILA